MADAQREALDRVRTNLKKYALFKNLRVSADYSDILVTCREDEHKVHENVVCSRSEFFRRAERFRIEDDEATNSIDLPKEDSQLVRLLIEYIHEGEYDPPLPRDAVEALPDGSPIVTAPKQAGFHYQFPHTCDKHVIDGLKELAKETFKRSCNSHWDTKYFAPATHFAFSSTLNCDKGLRAVIIRTIRDHNNFLNKPKVIALLHKFNNLAVSLLEKNAKAISWTRPEPANV
ncbi:hypothetical protein E8E11_002083 [Didymella keratinophila]|nr:hypothetical protein E8E11_002083 [Didymella keratinophila]